MNHYTTKKLHANLKIKTLSSYFINILTKTGKRATAKRLYNQVMFLLKQEYIENSETLLFTVLNKIRPFVSLKTAVIAGTAYKVPIPISVKQQYFMAIHWLILNSKKRTERLLSDKLYNECLETLNEKSASFKQRLEFNNLVDKNRAFGHFRW